MIEITESPDTTQWREFVLDHPHGNIFQTPEMAEVYRRTKNYEPVALAVVDTMNGEMLVVLQAVAINEMNGILKHSNGWSDGYSHIRRSVKHDHEF